MFSKRNSFRLIVLILLSTFWLLQQCTTPSILATQSIQKGDELNNQNKYPEAIVQYEEYLKLSPQLGVYRDLSMEAEVNRKLAYAYSTQGKYKTALERLSKAIRVDSAQKIALALIEDYRQTGLIHAYSGDFISALKNLQKSLLLSGGMLESIKSEKQASFADTHLALAQVNLTLGNYKEAKSYALSALSIYIKIPDGMIGQIEANLILGIVARDKGDLQDAIRKIDISDKLAIQSKLNNGRQLQALGEVFTLKGELETALQYKLKALEQAENTNIKPSIVNANLQIGDAYQRLGDQKKSTNYYNRALEINRKMNQGDSLSILGKLSSGNSQQVFQNQLKSGSNIGAALANLRLGEMNIASNQLDSALVYYNQAKELFLKIGHTEGLAKVNLELAKTLVKRNNESDATLLLDQALNQTIQLDLKWQIYFTKGIAEEQANRPERARAHYEKSIEIIDQMRGNLTIGEFKTLFANTKVDVYDRLILLLLRNKNLWADLSEDQAIEKAFNASEQARSRTFLDMLGSKKIDAKQESDSTLLNEEQLFRLKIKQLTQEIIKVGDQAEIKQKLQAELDFAQRQHSILLEKISLNNPGYSSLMVVDPVSLKTIQTKLDAKTVILEYWVSEEATIIWTISQQKIDAELVQLKENNLLRSIRAARNAISLQLPESENQLKYLYQNLISPVENIIKPFNNLIIIPHNSLHFIPFHAFINSSNKFLIEQAVVSYAPSASVLSHCLQQKGREGNKFLGAALGDIKIGEFTGLPGTEAEIDQISKLYPDFDKKSKYSFFETDFKQVASSYNFIHIATHGVFNRHQPLQSYLLMNKGVKDDGQLTVDEIFGLNVSSKLVTLSACETALGDIGEADELVGLSRAFIYAGTPSVIVSLWKVDDATTSWLMTRFHQYLKSGNNLAESLTYAQRDLIQRNFTGTKSRGLTEVEWNEEIKTSVQSKPTSVSRNPYFWAPFVLIGNGFVY